MKLISKILFNLRADKRWERIQQEILNETINT
jgi:hypothetical protein